MKYFKIITITLIIGIILFIGMLLLVRKEKLYTKNLFYMDTYIEIKLYSKDKVQADKALKEIDKIYKNYHELSDRYHEYNNLTNVYSINHNLDSSDQLKLDIRLYELIEFGLQMSSKSNNLLDINMGCVIDIWKKYRDNNNGIPSNEELNQCQTNPIILNENNNILNNKPDIDLGSIAKGYATEKVGQYLKSIKMNKFLINAGGNVLTGEHYNNKKYKIGVENPNDGSIYKTLKVSNTAIVTSGGYERFYIYEDQKYHHIIDPNTNYPTNYMKSVTVISKSSALADALSTILFLMPIEAGKKFIQNYDVEVIWYNNQDEIITTEGINMYE